MHLSLGRKKYFLSALLLSLVFLLPHSLQAQRYRFKYYSHHDGLKDPEVRSLLQDREGFLWVGTTGGLYKYDGVRFTRVGEPTIVGSLAQTPDGKLWVGTRDGLACLRGDHFEFMDLPEPVRIEGTSSIAANNNGWLYVATSNGLYIGRPNGSGLLFEHYANPRGISSPAANSVHLDAQGVVWFGCGDSLCSLTDDGIHVLGRDA